MESNEDASRILKDILNIGGLSVSENGQDPSLSLEDNAASDRLNKGLESAAESVAESVDSYSEQESASFTLDPVLQFVNFTADEQQGSVSIYGNEVHITTNDADAQQAIAAGSNRVRITPVVNFDWEYKYYNGNLLSVSSKYMAYTLRGKSGFMVRILNRKTVHKALIKGFTGSIEDMSFAHCNSDQLACIDSAGDLFVWTISEEDNKILYNLKLHVKRKNDKLPEASSGNRLVWCPYVVDDGDEDESAWERVLAVAVGSIAEVFHVDLINESHGGTVDVDDIKSGVIRVKNGHTMFISDIALAPDGSVLATASEDGGVKFWQLDFQSGDPPRCLHEWQPHEGQAVSRLMFCDNHLVQDDKNPFWRFLITGARHNSELKIWCTVTWSCLQMIRFKQPQSSLTFVSPLPLKLKANLDLSAKYLVLSDIIHKVIYVFLLHQNVEEGKAHVTSVAHFLLTQPLLSFVISEAKMFKASVRDSMDQNGDREGHEEDVEGQEDSEDAKPIPTIRIKLHCINPKAMQEMTVQYNPFASIRPVTPSSVAGSSITNIEPGVQDGLSDVSGLDTSLTEEEDLETKSEPPITPNSSLKLIAPDAFSTLATKAAQPLTQTGQGQPPSQSELASVTSSITSVTSLNNSTNIDQLLGKSQMSDSSFKTCEDVTIQEHPSGVNSWLGQASPIGLPLPESPDPGKVPFPVFKSNRGVNMPSEDDLQPSTHSTPMRRHSPDVDEDKTPTKEDEISAEEQRSFSTSPPSFPRATREDAENLFPRADDRRQSPPESGNQTGTELRSANEAALSSMPSPVIRQQNQIYDVKSVDLEDRRPRMSQRNTNLTVTPRRQIDIQPDVTARSSDPAVSSAGLDEIRDDIRQLRELLLTQQQEQNTKVSEVLREEVAILEGAISSRLGSTLAQHAAEQETAFERFTRDKQVNEKQRYEKMTTSITTAVLNKVEKTVKNEIRNSVGSGIQKLTIPLQDQLNTVMTQKLTAADDVMKETIDKMIKDKTTLDAIGKAVGDAIQITFMTTMTEFVNKSMLPGFERACRSMYTQINAAFENGTKQYIQNFESYAENRKDIEKQQKDTVVEQLQVLVQNFQAASEKLSTSMSGSLLEMMQTQLTSSMKRLQGSLLTQLREDLNKSLQETIQKEIASAVVEQSAFGKQNESRNHAQQKNIQLRIEEMISEKDFSGAFQEALTAVDLKLVILVCQSCDPSELFAQVPCPLNQPILLSLIQQLSVDLSTETELKYRYLDEAIIALDTEDPITREHVTGILEGLCAELTNTIQLISQNDSANPLQRSLKRLLMAAKSLLK